MDGELRRLLPVSRYNISTAEYDGWSGAVNSSISRIRESVLDGGNNNEVELNRRIISELPDVYERFGFTFDQAKEVCTYTCTPLYSAVFCLESFNG